MVDPKVSADRLRLLLSYEPSTGQFRWNESRGRVASGDRAGSRGRIGYELIRIDGRAYLSHRLAWLYVHGQWPECDELDHINGVRSDNRISNLRLATFSQNRANSRTHTDNASGFKGVSLDRRRGKWQAQICCDYKKKHLGYFSTREDAYLAYARAANESFGEYAKADKRRALYGHDITITKGRR